MVIALARPSSCFTASSSSSHRSRRIGKGCYPALFKIRASLKQQDYKKQHQTFLPQAEEIASRFSLEAAIAELERAFKKQYYHEPGFPGGGIERPGPSGRPVRLAYQGTPGSYCQEAAAALGSGCLSSPLLIPCAAGMEEAFAALEDLSADRAVVPAENSVDGPVHRNLDLLLRHPDIAIVDELLLPVNHCLLSVHGVEISDVRRVVSHPQAISHCGASISVLNDSIEVEEVPCSTAAARLIADRQLYDTAVIGSRMAAEEFGLKILNHNFQDPKPNYNRYFQLGLNQLEQKQAKPNCSSSCTRAKTTLAFVLDKGPTDLFEAMWAFESRGVHVIRVDHRPNRTRPVRVDQITGGGSVVNLDYVFVIDVDGSESDRNVSRAIDRLAEIAGFVRVLGSYSSCG